MKVTLIHPGTQHSFYLASQLERLDLLYKFYTGLAISDDSFEKLLYNQMPSFLKNKYASRVLNKVPGKKVHLNRWLEYRTIFKQKKSNDAEGLFYDRNKKFQLAIIKKGLAEADAIIGFDTSSWLIAEECKKLSKKFILEVTTPHAKTKQAIDEGLIQTYPTWTNNIQIKDKHLMELEQREMDLAEVIVVPSQFVKDSYTKNKVSEEKIVINPFGTDVSAFKPNKNRGQKENITYLFFGSLTARKGLPFLLETWKKFHKKNPNTELLIAGFGKIDEGYAMPNGVNNLGSIAKPDRQALFDKADIFVFPSYFEGLAQVQIEAAACGLPVIGTTNSGAAELVTNGEEGFVVSPGNKEELFNAMEFFILNKNSIAVMGEKAWLRVNTHFTWDAYGERWKKILNERAL